jgi:hypothetical protein
LTSSSSSGRKKAYSSFKSVKWTILILLLAILILWAFTAFAQIEDDFEAYDVGPLIEQSDWYSLDCPITKVQVVSTTTYEGERAISNTAKYPPTSNCTIGRYFTPASTTWNGVQVFYMMVEEDTWVRNYSCLETEDGGGGLLGCFGIYDGDFAWLGDGGWTDLLAIAPDNYVWYALEMAWRDDGKIKFQVKTASSSVWEVSTGWEDPYDVDWTDYGTKRLRVYFNEWKSTDTSAWFDYFSEEVEEEAPAELRVWGISPVSGSEITSTGTEITIGYEGFNADLWDVLEITFYEEMTGILAPALFYYSDELATSGTIVVTFDDFGIDRNADWYLFSIAFVRMFFSSNVVSPEYYLDVNIVGLPNLFEMTNWEDWYATNTPYATATAVFSAIADFLSPFFGKIGEFGTRIEEFFNQDEAYINGYSLGQVVPIGTLYIEQFEYLFGGFPLIRLFLLGMVLMMGMFLIKLLIKLIRG